LLVQLVVRERAPVIVEAMQPCAGGADLSAQRAPELLEVDVRRGDVELGRGQSRSSGTAPGAPDRRDRRVA
jgi:hypothetical protein